MGASIAVRRLRSAWPAFVLLGVAGRANAADRVRLEWIRGENAESCPNDAAIAAEIARRLGRDPFSSDAESAVEVTVQHSGSAWTAHIQARGANGVVTAVRDLRS